MKHFVVFALIIIAGSIATDGAAVELSEADPAIFSTDTSGLDNLADIPGSRKLTDAAVSSVPVEAQSIAQDLASNVLGADRPSPKH